MAAREEASQFEHSCRTANRSGVNLVGVNDGDVHAIALEDASENATRTRSTSLRRKRPCHSTTTARASRPAAVATSRIPDGATLAYKSGPATASSAEAALVERWTGATR